MSKATLKFIRLSPNKARLIAREVQGMNAEYALASLEFAPNKAAGIISKVIASAVANGDFEPEEVEIISCRIDKGPVLKRFRPRARGSASRILKPTSHIMVEVGPATKVEKKSSEKKTAASKKPAKKESATKSVVKSSDLGDLKQLSGVGPAMEKKLQDEGITSVEQIAKMTQEQIAGLDAKIGVKGNIEDTWIAEAKEILKNIKKDA
jgi:large subunit ribosomal protein L22